MTDDSPKLDPGKARIQLLLVRGLLVIGLFLAFAGGRPLHAPLVPSLVPVLPFAGILMLAGVVGACVGFRDRASLIWLACFAAVAIPLHFAWSNTALEGFASAKPGALTGWGELVVRGAALGAIGVWINLERQRGVFRR